MKTFFIWFFLFFNLYFLVGAYIVIDLNENFQNVSSETNDSGAYVEYRNVKFYDIATAIDYYQRESTGFFFPINFALPGVVSTFILAFCSGSIGGVFRIFRDVSVDKIKINDIPVIYLLFFAGFLGLMLYGISYLLPTALTSSKNTPRPISIFFLSMFGGLFWKRTTIWLENRFKNIFLK